MICCCKLRKLQIQFVSEMPREGVAPFGCCLFFLAVKLNFIGLATLRKCLRMKKVVGGEGRGEVGVAYAAYLQGVCI